MGVLRHVLGALVVLISLFPAIASAVPLGSAFTYQGQLSQSGTPVDGTVHLRFSLWDAAGTGTPPTGGTQIGSSQIVTNVTAVDGNFSAEVNAGGEFGASAFNGQARWLQIEVCTDGTCTSSTVLGPRQSMTATPYALGPWQISGTSLNYTGGNVGIGTTAPVASLHVNTPGEGLHLQGTGGTAWIGFANASGTDLGYVGDGSSGDANIYLSSYNNDVIIYTLAGATLIAKNNGRVGIGTQTPLAKLDVRGDIRLGASGEYFVPGADGFNLRIVRGVVSNAGTRVFGTGFVSTRTGTGVYEITFDTPFVDQPSITATCQHASLDRIAIISSHFSTSCTIRVVSGSGTPVDCYFDIIAIGRR